MACALSKTPRQRSKALTATLVGLSLLGGAQVLAPPPAAAADDETWCFRIVNGSVQFVNECEGAGSGETIVVVGKRPVEPNRPPSGPGFDRDAGRDSDPHGTPRPLGGGDRIEPAPKKSPKVRVLSRRCRRYADTIKQFYSEERAISRGELTFLRFFFGGPVLTPYFEEVKRLWVKDGCPGPVPSEADWGGV